MEKKKKPYNSIYVYIIFGISFLLICSIIANIFFYYKSQTRIFDCNLGDSIELEYNEQDNFILANIVYPSNIVSGTSYNQKISLKTGDIKYSYFVRARAMYADYNIVNESISVDIYPVENWQLGPDNYYYLNKPIHDWENINFIESITLPTVYTDIRNNTIVSIVFQFLNTNLDEKSIWNVPDNFFESI